MYYTGALNTPASAVMCVLHCVAVNKNFSLQWIVLLNHLAGCIQTYLAALPHTSLQILKAADAAERGFLPWRCRLACNK
jgi:hypothetical protein